MKKNITIIICYLTISNSYSSSKTDIYIPQKKTPNTVQSSTPWLKPYEKNGESVARQIYNDMNPLYNSSKKKSVDELYRIDNHDEDLGTKENNGN